MNSATSTIVITGGEVTASGHTGIGANNRTGVYTQIETINITITGGSVTANGIQVGIGGACHEAQPKVQVLIDSSDSVYANGEAIGIGGYREYYKTSAYPDTTDWRGTVIENGVETVYPKSDETAP